MHIKKDKINQDFHEIWKETLFNMKGSIVCTPQFSNKTICKHSVSCILPKFNDRFNDN